MKFPGIFLIPSISLVLLQSACTVTSTVQSRIAQYPDYFEKLSTKHKDLVRQHRVTEGMGKEAVYLAWGTADEVKSSSRNGRSTEIWVYLRYEPIYTRSINVGYGYGGSRYYGGRRRNCGYGRGYGGYYGSGIGYDTDVTYQPYVGAKVEFSKGRVVFWETVR